MKIMRLVCVLLALASVTAVADSHIFLVRHAEKAVDQGRDPALTEQGEHRAKKIANLLINSDISQIYSTNFQRTRQTAAPLATQLGLEVKLYDPRKLAEFAKQLKQQSGNILVVGHSNTTPQLAALLTEQMVNPMTEKEYQHLFLVTRMGEASSLLKLSTD
ncbi:histidine phosphatase family protein [Kangiella sp. TOML190]|uniref:SixA phosphatase family protein n=1 Tax=Kangiella sp. TOML190 TaxID=2931351 RepID=UPI00203D2DD1|nr:phosphoglycerate mutase family protein [Kangiella sp. TOML190]